MPPFLPAPRQTNWLILLGFSALAATIYVRHTILEAEALTQICAGGAPLAMCGVRRAILELSALGVFGGVAVILAVLHFARPQTGLFAAALFVTVLGFIWGNPVASAFAAAVLTIAFARPRASSRRPAPSASPPATTPANSRTIH